MRDPTSIPILDCWESGHRPSDRLMLDLTTPISMGWAKGMWGSSCSGSVGCVFILVVTCLLILPSGSLFFALRHLVIINSFRPALRGRAMIQAGMRLELPGRGRCMAEEVRIFGWNFEMSWDFWTVGLSEKERDSSVHQFINAWLPLICGWLWGKGRTATATATARGSDSCPGGLVGCIAKSHG